MWHSTNAPQHISKQRKLCTDACLNPGLTRLPLRVPFHNSRRFHSVGCSNRAGRDADRYMGYREMPLPQQQPKLQHGTTDVSGELFAGDQVVAIPDAQLPHMVEDSTTATAAALHSQPGKTYSSSIGDDTISSTDSRPRQLMLPSDVRNRLAFKAEYNPAELFSNAAQTMKQVIDVATSEPPPATRHSSDTGTNSSKTSSNTCSSSLPHDITNSLAYKAAYDKGALLDSAVGLLQQVLDVGLNALKLNGLVVQSALQSAASDHSSTVIVTNPAVGSAASTTANNAAHVEELQQAGLMISSNTTSSSSKQAPASVVAPPVDATTVAAPTPGSTGIIDWQHQADTASMQPGSTTAVQMGDTSPLEAVPVQPYHTSTSTPAQLANEAKASSIVPHEDAAAEEAAHAAANADARLVKEVDAARAAAQRAAVLNAASTGVQRLPNSWIAAMNHLNDQREQNAQQLMRSASAFTDRLAHSARQTAREAGPPIVRKAVALIGANNAAMAVKLIGTGNTARAVDLIGATNTAAAAEQLGPSGMITVISKLGLPGAVKVVQRLGVVGVAKVGVKFAKDNAPVAAERLQIAQKHLTSAGGYAVQNPVGFLSAVCNMLGNGFLFVVWHLGAAGLAIVGACASAVSEAVQKANRQQKKDSQVQQLEFNQST